MRLKLVVTLLILSLFSVNSFNSNLIFSISNTVLISHVQSGGPTGRSDEEYIILSNVSDIAVPITDWCLQLASSGAAEYKNLYCFTPPEPETEYEIPVAGTVILVSPSFVINLLNSEFEFDVQWSDDAPKIATTNGSIRLINDEDEVVDMLGWGNGEAESTGLSVLSAGMVHFRKNLLGRFIDTDNNKDDFSNTSIVDACLATQEFDYELPDGFFINDQNLCVMDACLNDEVLTETIPDGFADDDGDGVCEEVRLEDRTLFITEAMPNPPGYDTGQEFIELYNPNEEMIELTGYRLQVGPGFTREYLFTGGSIKQHEYLTFSDSETKIILPNSSGARLRLIAPAGNTVSESAAYENSDDDVSWALVDDRWIFTNQITPGAANKPYLQPVVDEAESVTTIYAPCPAGKYRSPETNRCRNVETAVSLLTPCDEDEYRNPQTNRCRKLAATGSLTPCDEGEERNPETNRCRKGSVLTDTEVLADVIDLPTQSTPGSINWGVISLAVFATLGYMLYEWRFELVRWGNTLKVGFKVGKG